MAPWTVRGQGHQACVGPRGPWAGGLRAAHTLSLVVHQEGQLGRLRLGLGLGLGLRDNTPDPAASTPDTGLLPLPAGGRPWSPRQQVAFRREPSSGHTDGRRLLCLSLLTGAPIPSREPPRKTTLLSFLPKAHLQMPPPWTSGCQHLPLGGQSSVHRERVGRQHQHKAVETPKEETPEVMPRQGVRSGSSAT